MLRQYLVWLHSPGPAERQVPADWRGELKSVNSGLRSSSKPSSPPLTPVHTITLISSNISRERLYWLLWNIFKYHDTLAGVCLMTNLGRYFVFRTKTCSRHQAENYTLRSITSLLSLHLSLSPLQTPHLSFLLELPKYQLVAVSLLSSHSIKWKFVPRLWLSSVWPLVIFEQNSQVIVVGKWRENSKDELYDLVPVWDNFWRVEDSSVFIVLSFCVRRRTRNPLWWQQDFLIIL